MFLLQLVLLLFFAGCGKEGISVHSYDESRTGTEAERTEEDPGDIGEKDVAGGGSPGSTGEKDVAGGGSPGNTGEKDVAGGGEKASSSEQIRVHICGAVSREGVYTLPAGSRVCDGVDLAGGLTDTAAGQAVNLARILKDGERIYIPDQEEVRNGECREWDSTGAPEEGSTGENAGETTVNINTAGQEELMCLSGIGASRAADIVAYREENGRFTKPEDLMKVPGIKEATFRKLKDRIRVE